MEAITIESLIEQGNSLKKTLIQNSGSLYFSFENEDSYTTWKFTSIRAIEYLFPNDIDIANLKKAILDFEKLQHPNTFSQILGVLESYKAIPITITIPSSIDQPSIQINNSQSQNQEQTQSLQILVDLIKDELNGRQLKELKEIVMSGQDEESKKKSIKEKLKSFGQDLAPSILANIITNPQIWGALF